jgi:hypothetical protein
MALRIQFPAVLKYWKMQHIRSRLHGDQGRKCDVRPTPHSFLLANQIDEFENNYISSPNPFNWHPLGLLSLSSYVFNASMNIRPQSSITHRLLIFSHLGKRLSEAYRRSFQARATVRLRRPRESNTEGAGTASYEAGLEVLIEGQNTVSSCVMHLLIEW